MSHRRSEMMLGTKAILEGWPMSEKVKQSVVQMMLDITEGKIKSSPREKIRAAECLVKIGMLNVTLAGQEKSRDLNVQILPPAYEQMTPEANAEMISYLQATALPKEEGPETVIDSTVTDPVDQPEGPETD